MGTIKELIDSFCSRINIPRQASYVGNSAPAARQYLELLRLVGDDLRNRGYNWPQLKRPFYLTTETGVSRYQLPGDFYRLLLGTQWDTGNHWPMLGPVSDGALAMRKFAIVQPVTLKAYQLSGPTGHLFSTQPYNQRSAGQIEIHPAGANNTDQLFLGYISGSWIWPRDWVASTAYVTGALRSGNGHIYCATESGNSGTTRPNWSSGTDSDGGINWAVYTEPYAISASNSQLNDADFCLFDDDIMIEGMRWAWYRAKRQSYEQERADWERMVAGAAARFTGPVRGNMCESDLYGDMFPLVPEGSWPV